MRNWIVCLTAFGILTIPSLGAAQIAGKSRNQLRFESLRSSPGRTVKFYREEALILETGKNSYQAIFVTVQDANRQRICGYGPNLLVDFIAGTQSHELEASYVCQAGEQFKPYDGSFLLVYNKNCGEDVCPAPAAGVGNLSIRPSAALNLRRLPDELEIVIDGYYASSAEIENE